MLLVWERITSSATEESGRRSNRSPL